MRNCPICSIELSQVDYEGFKILRCDKCHGYLMPMSRLESIKRVAKVPEKKLRDDAEAQLGAELLDRLRCPRCRCMMKKQRAHVPSIELHMDVCKPCGLVWLDPGELELLQLAHQASARFRNAQEMKKRYSDLMSDPHRKARFEQALAELPFSKHPLDEAFTEAGEMLLAAILRCDTDLINEAADAIGDRLRKRRHQRSSRTHPRG